MAIAEVCDPDKLGTWIGIQAPDRIDIRLLVLGKTEIVESRDSDACGFGEKKIIPAATIVMFNQEGNTRRIRASRYAWELGCAGFPEIVTRPTRPSIIAFSERKGREWRRIDKRGRADEISGALWDSMMESLRKYYRDFVNKEPKAAIEEMFLGDRPYKYVRRLSSTPQLKAISMVLELHSKTPAKGAGRSFLGATRVVTSEDHPPGIHTSWPIAFATHLAAKKATEADPFLGEYTNGDYRLVLLGDDDDLTVVSLGRQQEILAKGRSVMEICD